MPDNEKKPSSYAASTIGEVFQSVIDDVRETYQDERGMTPELSRADLLRPGALGRRLKTPEDHALGYVRSVLTGDALQAYQKGKPDFDSEDFARALLSDLNAIVRGELGAPFYEEQRFRRISLRPGTLAVVHKAPKDSSETSLGNRLLLEDAFPGDIRRLRERPIVMMDSVDLEMTFRAATVNEKGWVLFGKDTEQSQLEIRLATRLSPPRGR